MNKAIFLDRDGTINEEMGYINHISRFRIFDFVFPAIRLFNKAGFKVIVITNQSGVARGYFSELLVKEIHSRLIKSAKENDAQIDGIYYCPHHKDGTIAEYKKECDCRKPKPGMLKKAMQDFSIEPDQSFMIGDRYKDMQFAFNNGLQTIMVMTGYGLGEYTYQRNSWEKEPDYICDNLLLAAQKITNLKPHRIN